MSHNVTTTQTDNKPYSWHRGLVSRRLGLPQMLTILLLFFFNSQILTYIPIKIGPLTPTIIIEIGVFFAVAPWLNTSLRNLGKRDYLLLLVGLCMVVLSLINLSGSFGEALFKRIVVSLYVYFMIVTFFSGHPEYRILLNRFHLFPAVAMLYNILSKFFGNYGITEVFDAQIGANQSAIFLVVILPICWAQVQHERGFFKFLNQFVIAGAFLSIALTGSRTALVVLFVVSTLKMLLEGSQTWLIILLILMFFFVFFLPEQNSFKSRIMTLQNPTAALRVERFPLWKAALKYIGENPLMGGNFRSNVHRLVLEVAPSSNYARHIIALENWWNMGIHNGYLAVAAYFGIIVAFFYFRFYFSLGRDLLDTRKKITSETNHRLLTLGFISLIGYAVANISHHVYIGQHFFTIWAILQSSLKNAMIEEETQKG